MLANLIGAPEPSVISPDYLSHMVVKITADTSLASLISGVALLIFGAVTVNPILMGIGGAMILGSSIALGVSVSILVRKKAALDANHNEIKSLFKQGIEAGHKAFDILSQARNELTSAENSLTTDEKSKKTSAIEGYKQEIRKNIMPKLEKVAEQLREHKILDLELQKAYSSIKQREIEELI